MIASGQGAATSLPPPVSRHQRLEARQQPNRRKPIAAAGTCRPDGVSEIQIGDYPLVPKGVSELVYFAQPTDVTTQCCGPFRVSLRPSSKIWVLVNEGGYALT
jgi:hypothetical protein